MIRLVSSLVMAASEYLVAISLVAVLFIMGMTGGSVIPDWLPSGTEHFSPWLIWSLLITIAFLRAVSQFISRHSGHALLEYVRARLKMTEAYRILILERERSLFISRLNTFMAEIIPRASDYVFAVTGMSAAILQTSVLAAGMIFLAWRETIVGILCLSIAGVVIELLNRRIRKTAALIPDQHSRFEKILVRISRNWLLIRILNFNRKEYNNYLDSSFDYFETSRNTFFLKNVAAIMPPLMGIIAMGIILLSSIEIFHTNPLRFVPFVYLYIRFTQSLVQITDLVSTANQFRSQYQTSSMRLNSLSDVELQQALKPVENLKMFSKIRKDFSENETSSEIPVRDFTYKSTLPDIKIKNISFSWPGWEHPLFKDFSLNIKGGERFGIVGPNGCGKSTLLGIILGMIIPDKGEVEIGGMNPDLYIKNVGSIGFVGEDPFLIEGTIRDNIVYGSVEDISDRDIKKMLEKVGLWKIVHYSGNGLDYIISENKEGLSAGEQQKLSLARALLRRPKLLVLDEVSSNIDAGSEVEICRILKNLGNNCTILIVSHKPGILKAAERVIDLTSSSSYSKYLNDVIANRENENS